MTDDNVLLDRITLSQNETELHRAVSDAVNRPGHTADSIDKVAITVKDTLSRINGAKSTKPIAQRIVAKALRRRPVQHPISPLEDWVFVAPTNKYVNVAYSDDPGMVSERQFNYFYDRHPHMPYASQTRARRVNPSTFTKTYPILPEVSAVGRFPGYGYGLVEVEGERVFNLCKPDVDTEKS